MNKNRRKRGRRPRREAEWTEVAYARFFPGIFPEDRFLAISTDLLNNSPDTTGSLSVHTIGNSKGEAQVVVYFGPSYITIALADEEPFKGILAKSP